MLKIDRKKVDKLIEGMDMYSATKQVLADYVSEKEELEKREKVLGDQLAQQQEQHATVLIKREEVKDSPSEYINLSKQLTEINGEVKILLSLQAEFKDEYKALKKKYMPLVSGSYSEDNHKRHDFDVDDSLKLIETELKQVISDYGRALESQRAQVMPLIRNEFLDDAELMNEDWNDPDRRRRALSFKRSFHWDNNRLIHRQNIKL